MARRLEAGQTFARDEELFTRLCTVGRQIPNGYPVRLWLALFSPELQARIPDARLKCNPSDRAALDYLTHTLEPAWSLRIATVTRVEGRTPRGRALCPKPLLPSLARAEHPQDAKPWEGVRHLMWGGHDEVRGRAIARAPIELAKKHLGDLKGKDLADIGSGSGPTLPAFRQAIGPDACLFAVEVDPMSLHLMQHLHGDLGIRPVLGRSRDICLPDESVDWMVMTGVHMGAGLTSPAYEEVTLPWLESMNRALRPGGVLIIDEDHQDLLQDGAIPKTERAGFRLLELRQGAEFQRAPGEWIALFRATRPRARSRLIQSRHGCQPTARYTPS